MRKDAKLELLRQVPLFAGCTKKELDEISTLADELSLPAGAKLIEEGRHGHEFFLLVDGSVDVSAKGRKLKTLSDGAFFGEMALVSQRPRNATVTAASPIRVLVVHESGFRRLLHDSPQIQLKVLQTLADRAAENAPH
ncbi:MAG TPA: cyclic nucleotide-binding domain-containing protein [Gaiellaceae bacterium]|nr:cyclic nucleotide-binding domain-containing protein [Gaiellaceae bacterium]